MSNPKSIVLRIGYTVKKAFVEKPFKAAVIVVPVRTETWLTVKVKLALVAPAGTVTLAGNVTGFGTTGGGSAAVSASHVLESVTTAPPAGAGLYSVTVPVNESPPTGTRCPVVMSSPLMPSGGTFIDNTVSTGLTLRKPIDP